MSSSENNIYPFLTFTGKAEEAMKFYISFFPNAEIQSVSYIREGDRGEVGKVLNGRLRLKDQLFMVMDMEENICPNFSWATSFLIDCKSEEEFDCLFENLANGGFVAMGPEPLQTSQSIFRKCAWVTDKFGVTWQLIW